MAEIGRISHLTKLIEMYTKKNTDESKLKIEELKKQIEKIKKTMEQKEPENSFVNIVKRNLKPIEPKKQSIPINIRKLSTLRDIDERQISTPNESIEEQEEFDDDSSNDNREYDDNE